MTRNYALYGSNINILPDIIFFMSERRKLRSEGACQPLENIFKNEHYREILPPVVYAKITKTPTVNCDRIKDLKFDPTPNPS